MRSKRALWGVAGILALGAAVGFLWWHPAGSAQVQQQKPKPVPVTTIQADHSDFPIYIESLGTVQPLNLITLRSRVDGEIVKVNFREGQMVRQGDLLLQIDPRPYQAQLDQAKAKKAQDEATLQNATLDLQRSDHLLEMQAGSRQQRDTQASQVTQYAALVQADQAAIDSARVQLDYTSIRAPITGRASFNLTTIGNIVHSADQTGIVSIAQIQPISVVFTAPEEQIGEINQAFNTRSIEVLALSSDGNRKLATGALAVINNQVDVTSGTIQLKASFDNKDNALWPGLSVTTRLLVKTLKDAIVIPDKAVQRGPDGYFVYAIDGDNKAQQHKVKVGQMTDGRAVIENGLAVGDRVVTEGQYRLGKDTLVAATDQTPNDQRTDASGANKRASTGQSLRSPTED